MKFARLKHNATRGVVLVAQSALQMALLWARNSLRRAPKGVGVNGLVGA